MAGILISAGKHFYLLNIVINLLFIDYVRAAGIHDWLGFGDESESSREAFDEQWWSKWYHWLADLTVNKPERKTEPESFLQRIVNLSICAFNSVLHMTKTVVTIALNYTHFFSATVRDCTGIVVSRLASFVPNMPTLEISWNLMALIIAMFVILSTLAIWIVLGRRKKPHCRNSKKSDMSGLVVFSSHTSLKRRTAQQAKRKWYHWVSRGMIWMVIVAAILSVPWEFIRLYQIEVAKKAAVIHGGLPADCDPQSMGLWQTMKSWLQWQFSWSDHNPCEQYYNALLVEPVWEVTPMLVLSSVVTRCIVHPLEVLSSALGRCLKYFFREIPAQWQPILMVIIVLLFLAILLMKCGYRLRLPCFITVEPKTPTSDHVRSQSHLITDVEPTKSRTKEPSLKQKSSKETVSDPSTVITNRKKSKSKDPKYG